MTQVAQIQRALDAEAAQVSTLHRGLYVFERIRAANETRANWTASFHCIASACPMDEMRGALERVQTKFPVVNWTP